MSNKKLTKYYVLSPRTYDVLLKNSINENKLSELDKHMFNVLKNDRPKMAEKWLMYSQELAKHGLKIRHKNKFSPEREIIKSKKVKFSPLKSEQFTQTEEEELPKPQYAEQAIQVTPKKTQSEIDEEDEEYENLYRRHRSKILESSDDSINQTLEEELYKIPSRSPLPRRSARIKKQKMPKEFDADTEEAAMLFVQTEMNDPIDRNFSSRKSLSPRRKIFEHKPTGAVITVDLEDVVEVVDDDDDNEKIEEKKRKKRKHIETTPSRQKTKKRRSQIGKGISSIKWEKY